jgi:hypothetical protein
MAGPNEATLSQYKTLTEEAGIVRLPHRSIIEISGADRVGFVHNFCTNDIKKLSEGRGCEAFFTSHQGKTVGHGLVFAEPDALIVETTSIGLSFPNGLPFMTEPPSGRKFSWAGLPQPGSSKKSAIRLSLPSCLPICRCSWEACERSFVALRLRVSPGGSYRLTLEMWMS